ncbi:hypothetical protein NHX12_013649 [Muraenolepis orangiensis]|uniref:Uncharacterized protein n=1 Tax=Muraenolepis orangiensis TaxID=630683 RepID=A0A9Q0DBX0_9TELE|nr:hypothetical protein NHX12_013649 [Muraenolepis orangiensis]
MGISGSDDGVPLPYKDRRESDVETGFPPRTFTATTTARRALARDQRLAELKKRSLRNYSAEMHHVNDLLTRGGKDIAFSDFSPLWKSHRRLVHSSFTLFGEGTQKLQDIVLSAVGGLCEELQASGGGGPVDPGPAVSRAVTNVVCTLVFGSTYGPDDPELAQVMEYNDGIVETITRGGLVDIYPCLKVFPSEVLSKLKECISVRDRLLTRKLEEHKASMTEDEPRDLLDALIQAQTPRGVETTSTTLLWILAYLIHHPQVQERVQRELDKVVGRGRGVCGTRVLVNMWAIHHDPQHWDQPDLFKPERFLDDQGRRKTPPCFLPFGAGPRVCVGESLARMELFLFLSSLLQRMSFRRPDGAPPPDLQGRVGVVLQPLPYKVLVIPREVS